MNIKNLFIFFGLPGSGKGTLAQQCALKFNWSHISTGNLCRRHIAEKTDIGMNIASLIEKGMLIPNDLMFDMIIHEFEKIDNNNIIIDGFPRTADQIDMCSNWLKKINNLKVYVVFLDASEETIKDRLKNRIICSNNLCDKTYSKKDAPLFCSTCNSKLIVRQDDISSISIENRLMSFNDHKKKMLLSWNNDSFYTLIYLDANLNRQEVFNHLCSFINISV